MEQFTNSKKTPFVLLRRVNESLYVTQETVYSQFESSRMTGYEK